jgi:hypothetical protein
VRRELLSPLRRRLTYATIFFDRNHQPREMLEPSNACAKRPNTKADKFCNAGS